MHLYIQNKLFHQCNYILSEYWLSNFWIWWNALSWCNLSKKKIPNLWNSLGRRVLLFFFGEWLYPLYLPYWNTLFYILSCNCAHRTKSILISRNCGAFQPSSTSWSLSLVRWLYWIFTCIKNPHTHQQHNAIHRKAAESEHRFYRSRSPSSYHNLCQNYHVPSLGG